MSDVEDQTRPVGWLELFFDLVFVVIVERLTEALRGSPQPADFVKVAGLFCVVWIAWLTVTIFVNLSADEATDRRIPVLVSMTGVGLIAISIPEATGDGAPLFVAGLAVARLAMWPSWIKSSKATGHGWLRPTIYGPGTAALWLMSTLIPLASRPWVWLVIVVVELVSGALGFTRRNFTGSHLLERVGLFVMIVLGESVVELILSVRLNQSWLAWAVSAEGFVLVCSFWWQYFKTGAPQLQLMLGRTSGAVLRDVVIIAHFLIVLGLVGIAAGLGSAIEHADDEMLPYGSVIALCGGMCIYHLADVLIAWRYGARPRDLALRVIIAVGVTSTVATIGARWPAWLLVALLLLDTAADQFLLPLASFDHHPRKTPAPSAPWRPPGES